MMNPFQDAYSDIFLKDQLDVFLGVLEKSKQITIVTHYDADGDAIGSSLGLYHFLNNFGKYKIHVVTPNDYPVFLHWMPGQSSVQTFEGKRSEIERFVKESDLIFYVDFNTLPRLKKMQVIFENLNCNQVMIDHHPLPGIPCL